MKRNVVETVLGAVVIIGALVFLTFSYKTSNTGDVTGYRVTADFSDIGGLKVGDEVQVSGVKVGQIAGIALDPKAYLARVTIEVGQNIKLPSDTAALISSTSLLGGKYLQLEPGGAEDYIENNGRIEFTQAPQNLEQLLGKFIFSVSDKKDEAEAPTDGAVPAEPASP
ncbi:MAG: outer membrane lipid asymmetry maintenance protein MlaD [Micavibrio aeruginosavorus]|uniref:Outer membrane lipid asymmetry maintenance protein MlaD n=1 Tax=Micavibrio aeruginosavorus TaxID=349221 RepID=A0A2W5FKN0_9BACT|nr:MAG: outer membrane lipid asymmetry maintenance protein MlaD [Micavibrio aeruginosavorus]